MQLIRNNVTRDNQGNTPADVMWPRIAVITSAVLLVLIGLVMVFSASSIANIDAQVAPYDNVIHQLGFAAFGAVLCLFLGRVLSHRVWQGPLSWIAFGISVVLLILTWAIGTEELGAQRWLSIGGFSFQPSEFAKIGMLLAVAKLVADYQDGSMSARTFFFSFIALSCVVLGLILVAQSDLGTTLICFIGMTAILWFAEIPIKYVGMYVGCFAGVGALAMTVGYRWDRLTSFLNPWDDYYGTGYQIIHSMYAFAQGGIFGTGLGNSAEKYLYLPEASTDFIFSIIGEELGLVGALLVLGLFVVFLLGGLRMAQAAPDRFGAIICGSFAVIIVFQAFLNMGCVIGVLPVTGKPLPFVSYGGSSLIASLMMLGIMLSVSFASGESPVYQRRRESIRPIDRDEYSYSRQRTAIAGTPYRSNHSGGRVRALPMGYSRSTAADYRYASGRRR